MAHRINTAFNILEGKQAILCNDGCKFWKYPHLENACILSEVFSVTKGSLCYEYISKKE